MWWEQAEYRQYKEAGLTDLTWKLYKDDHCEVLNELDRDVVYKNIASWMAVKVKKHQENKK